jgi:hypothetical protein
MLNIFVDMNLEFILHSNETLKSGKLHFGTGTIKEGNLLLLGAWKNHLITLGLS